MVTTATAQLKQLTIWDSPETPVAGSQYGNPPYADWCLHEAQRIANHGVQPAIRSDGGSRIALFIVAGQGRA